MVAVQDAFLEMACSTGVGPTRAKTLVAILKDAGYNSLGMVQAIHPSFQGPKVAHDAAALAALNDRVKLSCAKPAINATWPPDPAAIEVLSKVIAHGANLAQAEAMAQAQAVVAAVVPAASAGVVSPPPAVTATATTAAAEKATALRLFTTAEAVFGTPLDADKRAKYEMVAKTHKAFLEQAPVAFGLCEFQLQITAQATETVTYEMMGETYTKVKEGGGGSNKITVRNFEQMYELMRRRDQVNSTAGCFSFTQMCADQGRAAPVPDDVTAASTKEYVRRNAAGAATVESMDCFATPAGQFLKIQAMREFVERNPSVTPAQCINIIDAGVEKEIANLIMRGKSADKAVEIVCLRSPHKYAYSLVEHSTPDKEGQPLGADGEPTPKKNKGKGNKDRTPEQANEAQKRRIEQQERQIENLKRGGKHKKGGAPWGGGGKGGDHWGGGQGGDYWGPPRGPPHGPPQGPPGNGRPFCPDGLCKDFNFTVCTRQPCNRTHRCCKCGGDHPAKNCRG